AANAILPTASFEVLQAQRVHALGIPDRLHGFPAHVADDELAAPIQKTGTDETVGVHRVAVEDIRTRVGIADVLLIDAFADFDAGVLLDVEFRPAWREIFDKDAVAMVAESVKELLALRFGNKLAGNFDDNFAITLVLVDPLDVLDEFREIELEPGEFVVGFLIHAVDRDVDLVDTGF